MERREFVGAAVAALVAAPPVAATDRALGRVWRVAFLNASTRERLEEIGALIDLAEVPASLSNAATSCSAKKLRPAPRPGAVSEHTFHSRKPHQPQSPRRIQDGTGLGPPGVGGGSSPHCLVVGGLSAGVTRWLPSLYLYTPEIYPTRMRAIGTGAGDLVAASRFSHCACHRRCGPVGAGHRGSVPDVRPRQRRWPRCRHTHARDEQSRAGRDLALKTRGVLISKMIQPS